MLFTLSHRNTSVFSHSATQSHSFPRSFSQPPPSFPFPPAIPPDTSVCVLELGMSAAGEIALLSRLSLPCVRVLLNVGAAHLGSLGSLDAVAAAKGELLASARPSDTLVLNGDDGRVMALDMGEAGRKVRWRLVLC